MIRRPKSPEAARLESRREFIKKAAAGSLVVALGGGLYRVCSDDVTRAARAQVRRDGRQRLPPGQRVIEALRPMGGEEGSPRTEDFRLQVHGDVDRPFTVDWKQLLAMPVSQLVADVHCVTSWSVLGNTWAGVQVKYLAERAGVRKTAHHVVFEAAHGYTANVRLEEAMAPNVLVAYQMNGKPFPRRHGAPVRGLVPDLYFWKSAKWLTGIKFVQRDEPGYWEVRGYHNHANPWREERYG
jgi:DMSO/TMAO reductase YedYZ molybdopterin-dependent catalytic subunit